ncbi:hypothetical protein FRC11_003025 [Ceratobasidium sp. 423]|nr:hypothetical protein FRC11_003025 [Ceratobasidium sp. 423]
MRLSLAALAFAALLPPSLASKCENPEIRKEWRRFSKAEQAEWIRAVNCLNKKPASGKLVPPIDLSPYPYYDQIVPISNSSSYQDELTYVHMNLNPVIHNTGLFLPWHRWYLQSWTDALRTQCGYKGVAPYWAWEFDAANFEKSSIFNADKTWGLGTWGDPSNDYTVKDGGFANLTFAYPTDLGGLCPSSATAAECPSSGAPTISPNEPMFFLHHGNIDRLWWLWQKLSSKNQAAFAGGSVQNFTRPDLFPNGQAPWLSTSTPIPTAGMYKSVTIGDVLDTTGDTLCYIYL